ncbi:hypothetical protein HOY80DRAFT_1032348 [Tuber brumale]|nr:hypothetical protein HOY80DRAFT_1032348 [Tuber brumale]
MSKFVANQDPHGDGVRAIVKDKTATFLEAKKAARLWRRRDTRERSLEVVRAHKEKKEGRRQEKAMAGKGTGEMLEETIRICREEGNNAAGGANTEKGVGGGGRGGAMAVLALAM